MNAIREAGDTRAVVDTPTARFRRAIRDRHERFAAYRFCQRYALLSDMPLMLTFTPQRHAAPLLRSVRLLSVFHAFCFDILFSFVA